MGDEISCSIQLAVDGAQMTQLGELLVSDGVSVPLRLVPVGGGQFLLARLTEDQLDSAVASASEEELKSQLAAVQSEVVARLERLSHKLSQVGERCQGLADRLLQLTVPAGLPSRTAPSRSSGTVPAGGMVEDYPSGSWLGDPTDPEARIRVPIASTSVGSHSSACAKSSQLDSLDHPGTWTC